LVACRLATAADAAAVEALAAAMDASAGRAPEPGFAARYAAVVASPDHAVLLAVVGARAVGYALVQDFGRGIRRSLSVARMHDLYVDPGARRRGAGRALVRAVVDWCRERPQPLVLDWQARLDAVPFYDSLGLVGDRVGDTAAYPAYAIDLREPPPDALYA
jgi:GNAT superfamily N-acetyltransferase